MQDGVVCRGGGGPVYIAPISRVKPVVYKPPSFLRKIDVASNVQGSPTVTTVKCRSIEVAVEVIIGRWHFTFYPSQKLGC